MNIIEFKNPEFFLLFPFVVICLILVSIVRNSRFKEYTIPFSSISVIGNSRFSRNKEYREYFDNALFLGALLVVIIILAQPFTNRSVTRNINQTIFLFDTSNSMLTSDVEPNRLGLSRNIAANILNEIPEEDSYTGVMTFNQEPFILSNLQSDETNSLVALANLSLADLTSNTAIGDGMYEAAQQIQQHSRQNNYNTAGTIFVFTDGANSLGRDPLGVLEDETFSNIQFIFVGVGSESETEVEITLNNGEVQTVTVPALESDRIASLGSQENSSYYLVENLDEFEFPENDLKFAEIQDAQEFFFDQVLLLTLLVMLIGYYYRIKVL